MHTAFNLLVFLFYLHTVFLHEMALCSGEIALKNNHYYYYVLGQEDVLGPVYVQMLYYKHGQVYVVTYVWTGGGGAE